MPQKDAMLVFDPIQRMDSEHKRYAGLLSDGTGNIPKPASMKMNDIRLPHLGKADASFHCVLWRDMKERHALWIINCRILQLATLCQRNGLPVSSTYSDSLVQDKYSSNEQDPDSHP